ncbi:MAG: hypothetical protein HOP31_03240 [Ignavibacteria bacterium]|nr:hypothetical protein [Ignavibacteria bacterium]
MPFIVITVSLIFLYCSGTGSQVIHLKLTDAAKILGENAHVADSSGTLKENVTRYQLAYIADSIDKKSGKTGAVYYVFDEYKDTESAHKIYKKFYDENKDHEGITVLKDVGDEAYFHSDGENFYYISVRKGNKMIMMKVNKITSKTSLDEFNRIARNIAEAL